MIKKWKIGIFAAVLAAAAAFTFYGRPQGLTLKLGKPMATQDGRMFLLPVEYGKRDYFVACFGSPEALARFIEDEMGADFTRLVK